MADGDRREARSAFAADPRAVYTFVGAFFASLRASGARHVVISPGSRSTPLAIVARHTPGLRTWVELDERAAGFFALGLAKSSGRPALLVCTSGTAAANYLPAVVEAHYSRVPMLLATADRPPELRDWGAGQTIDQTGLYGRYPRWAVEVPTPTEGADARRYASQLAARAFATATASPAGAVHLNWPLREPLAPPVGELDGILSAVAASTSSAAQARGPRFSDAGRAQDPADVRELVELVGRREKGVVCCGPMDPDPALRRAIARFSVAAGWPVLADPASNLRAEPDAEGGSDGAPILAHGDALARSAEFREAMRPDVVLRIGATPVSKAQRLWIEAAEPESHFWLDEGEHWGEPSHRATRVVRGGAAALLEASALVLAGEAQRRSGEGPRLASEAPRRSQEAGTGPLREREWCRRLEAANAAAAQAMRQSVRRPENWSGLAVAAAVARLAPAGSQLFVSNSMSIRWLDLGYARRASPLRVLCSRGASGIDGVTSTALGAAAAAGSDAPDASDTSDTSDPSDGPTILLTGDLAFLHDLSGLSIARRERIPLVVVVVDDNGGGIFSSLPVAAQGENVGFRELFRTPHDLDLARVAALFELDYDRIDDDRIDYERVGEDHVEGSRVEALAAFEAAIERALARPSVSIVHVPIEASENEARFRRVLAAACEAVEASLAR